MIETYRDLMSLLLPQERRTFYFVITLAMASAIFEAGSVASILPLLTVLAEPELIQENAYLKWAYDTLGFTAVSSFQVMMASVTFALVIVGLFLKILTFYAITRYGAMRAYAVSTRLLQGYLHQPYAFFLTRHSTEVSRVILYEVYAMVLQVLMPFLQMAASFLVVLFLVAVLFVAEPLVATTLAGLFSGVYGAIYLAVRSVLGRLGQQRVDANEQRFRVTQEATEGIKYAKLRGLEGTYTSGYRKGAYLMALADSWILVLRTVPRHVLELIGFGGMLVFILFNLTSGTGGISQLVPTLGLIAFAGLRLLPALQNVFAMFAAIRGGKATLDAVKGEFDALSSPVDATSRADLAPLKLEESLEVSNVCYTYPGGDKAAISSLNMTIKARSTIGIVGGTGAGKSTAVDLILALLSPQSGDLLIDGHSLDSTMRKRWQRSLGYVPQTIYLTADSVASNIAFGVPTDQIDMERVITVAKIASLHEFIETELSDGYETLIGERGIRLSGGQRQRIGIARALYFDPEVLVFDEATSALDNITEHAVMEAIEKLGGQKTIIMIAHRLSTVKNCDRIFVLEHGQVTASGPYDELATSSKTFKDMIHYAQG